MRRSRAHREATRPERTKQEATDIERTSSWHAFPRPENQEVTRVPWQRSGMTSISDPIVLLYFVFNTTKLIDHEYIYIYILDLRPTNII